MPKPIVVDQCLHGYDDGHELLASSIKTSRRDGYLLSLLSDLSGQNAPENLSGYLTGYPLVDAKRYVIACTWLASELPRPGCAWTHSLLIEFGDLSQIASAGFLLTHFRRPNVIDGLLDRRSFSVPLQITVPNEGQGIGMHLPEALPEITAALYSLPEQKIFVIPDGVTDYGQLALALWSQQWPRLRRSFRFCTGSLRDRSDRDQVFDLQVVASRHHASAIWSLPNAKVVGPFNSAQQISTSDSSWLAPVIHDLLVPGGTGLRRFLWRYGAETSGSRADFQSLASIYQMMSDTSDSFSRVFKAIDAVDSLRQISLRRHLFLRPLDDSLPLPPIAAADALTFLLENSALHDLADVSIAKQLARKVWTDHGVHKAASVLIASQDGATETQSRAYMETVAAFGDLISEEDLPQLIDQVPSAFALMVRTNPSLVLHRTLWKASDKVLNEVLLALGPVRKLNGLFLDKIVRLALDRGSISAVEFLVSQDPERAVGMVLDWVEAATTPTNAERIGRMLGPHSAATLRWIQNSRSVNPTALAIALASLRFDLKAAKDVERNKWLPLANAKSLWNADVLVQSKSLVLALALETDGEVGARLAAGTFSFVHHALEWQVLPPLCWSQLADQLPTLSWYNNRNLPERLRQGILDCFIDRAWPVSSFFGVVADLEVLEQIFRSRLLRYRQESFLSELRENVRRGRVTASKQQKAVIEASRL